MKKQCMDNQVPKQMQAQVINAFGPPSVFSMMDLPTPSLKPGFVLVKVHATSVNPIDTKVRSGVVAELAPPFPAILHADVAGVIVAVGEAVHDFKEGEEIFGCAGGFLANNGALAEYMLTDIRHIAKKPKSLTMLEAAALPLVGITAWIALFEKLQLQKNKNILIYGGMGGVGHVAVQLAKWSLAKVYTTIRQKEDFLSVKKLGADEVIQVQEEEVEAYKQRLTKAEGFEYIFDTVGDANLDKSFAAAAENGRIVTIAARSTNDLTPMHVKGLSLFCVSMLEPLLNHQHRETYHTILTKIAEIVDEGKLRPMIDKHAFTMKDVAKAHALLESGDAKGKIVIAIGNSDKPTRPIL